MKVTISIISFLVVVSLLGILYLYSGFYDISAVTPHNSITRWLISTTMDNSVHHHAKDVTVPSNLNDPEMLKVGFQHYREMCKGCHGGPGIDRGMTAMSMYPHPPKLVRAAEEWSPADLFWITKNGIKMTGMPAFGKTHSDEKIWAIVSFLDKMPSMSHDDWVKMDTTISADHDDD